MRSFRSSWLRPIVLVALTFSIIDCTREAHEPSVTNVPAEAVEVAGKYLECVKNGDAGCAANLFHYRTDETVAERRAEVEAVRQSIAAITRHFGAIGSIQEVRGRVAYLEIAVGSADIAYWQKYPEAIKATYTAKFSEVGEGFIGVELCNISGTWEVRSVHYGLPAADPRSPARMLRVFKEVRGTEVPVSATNT